MKFAYASGTHPLEGFTIKRGVGSGGFGEVYFATSDAGKEVALKRVQRNADIEMRGATQCLNFKHLNLVALFDIKYDDDGAGWIVMEFVSGESLRDVIDRYPEGMPRAEMERWFAGIAAAVAYLHRHGIVHRDLKPGNVFDDDGVVKVGDYGLSKFISGSRRHDQTESVGTFHYMAPEIGKGVYGKEIDVYALGIMLYEMLSGRVPFEGESSQEIIMKHLTDEPDVSGLPVAYRSVVSRALRKDPRERFATVAEMQAAVGIAPEQAQVATPRSVDVKPPIEHLGTVVISDDRSHPSSAADATVAGHRLQKNNESVTAEPVAQAVRDGGSRVLEWWRNAPQVLQIGSLICGVLLLWRLQGRWLFYIGMSFGFVYAIYFVIRVAAQAMSRASQPRGTPASGNTATPKPPRAARKPRVPWQQLARADLRAKTMVERFTELSGGLLISALVVGILSLVMLIVAGQPIDGSIDMFARFAWLAIVSMVGSWGVLVSCKFWEGESGEPLLRRFLLLGLGLLWGFGGYFGGDFLSVHFSPSGDQHGLTSASMMQHVYPESLFLVGGGPTLAAYLVYFGGLLAILRWWKQADPLRPNRFSLFATALTAIGASFLPLPLPWGPMVALTTSAAVQLSASWVPAQRRLELRRRSLQG